MLFYLAMTAAEVSACRVFPEKCAWMACHFSPYGSGISNVPADLPAGSMLILNDRIPILHHDPETVARELCYAVEALDARCVLLDLQRPVTPEAMATVKAVLKALPCPTAVTAPYGEGLSCSLFLSPPSHIPLEVYLEPFGTRDIWLEISAGQETVTVTSNGCRVAPGQEIPEKFSDSALHCHYRTEVGADRATFHLGRTREDIQALLKEAEALGISHAAGLYQELA